MGPSAVAASVRRPLQPVEEPGRFKDRTYKKHDNENYRSYKDYKMIGVYCRKGGVSKTTTCNTVAHKLAAAGKRVLAVDLDSQNDFSKALTSKFAKLWDYDYEQFFRDHGLADVTVKTAMMACHEAQHLLPPNVLQVATYPAPVEGAAPGYLYLLRGDDNMEVLDDLIAQAEVISLFPGGVQHKSVPGLFSHLMQQMAWVYNLDYIIVDFPPSANPLTRYALMSLNGFWIPVGIDDKCRDAVTLMADRLPEWAARTDSIRTSMGACRFPLPESKPKFLGLIYTRLYGQGAVRSGNVFDFVRLIQERVRDNLQPRLGSCDMLLPAAYYTAWKPIAGEIFNQLPLPYKFLPPALPVGPGTVAVIKDYKMLDGMSQRAGRPVPFLRSNDFTTFDYSAYNDYVLDNPDGPSPEPGTFISRQPAAVRRELAATVEIYGHLYSRFLGMLESAFPNAALGNELPGDA